MKRLLLSLIGIAVTFSMAAQSFTVSGVILDKETGKPVDFATILLTRTEQWAIADADGKFSIQNVQPGKNTVSVSCLGYVTDTKEITISRDILEYKIYLQEDNLTLESVVVTARENENSATTSRMVDRTALDHIQMLNVADVASLLPGGKTVKPDLTDTQTFNIRAGMGSSTEMGNSSFGTAVEVDGVRLSDNSNFNSFTGDNIKGVATNNIASSNVESIEVITGVPSVEYGDMTSGIVKINTRKGRTPYTITMSTNPRMKQLSASKGFGLGETSKGRSNGVLNASLEYTKAISNQMSPFTAYDRNQASLTYSNLFNSGIFSSMPLRFSFGITGNIGGNNSEADPDTFQDTFTKTKDNTVRSNVSFNWLLSKKWITNLELNASISYSDKLQSVRTNKNSSSSTVALHGREEGYFVAQDYETNPDAEVLFLPRGYWYENMFLDDRPLNYKIGLKANWAKQIGGGINNKLKVGVDWTGDGNFGIGQYTDDFSTAPTFREYRYCDIPFMNNLAAYVEENITIPIGKTRLNLIAGVRNDNAIVNGSLYGTTSSWSPRFNAKYTIFSPKDRRGKFVRELSIRASWGLATKLPSFSVLYPTPTYKDILTFSPTSASDASAYYAYYTLPRVVEYNQDLKWQKNRMSEVGMEIDLGGNRISLAGYYNTTLDAYRMGTEYDRFSYNYTDAVSLDACTIPVDNRGFEVDRNTGVVTVHDKTGAQASEVLSYKVKKTFNNRYFASNSVAPITRYGLEWIIDFKRIQPINTTIRLDGSFYNYREFDRNIEPKTYSQNGIDGEPFKYIGYYYGDKVQSNGKEIRSLSTNLTVTTHIPKVRMIISLKIEATLLSYYRYLSEREGGAQRSYVLSDKNDILSFTDASVYDGNAYTVLFPDYYISYDDPTPRNYLEDLIRAKTNDPNLYADLSKLAEVSGYINYFAKDYYSPYFSANLSVTKEIGNLASVSFYANNFFNNLGQVYTTKNQNYMSVDRLIPVFYYGLSLRLKF